MMELPSADLTIYPSNEEIVESESEPASVPASVVSSTSVVSCACVHFPLTSFKVTLFPARWAVPGWVNVLSGRVCTEAMVGRGAVDGRQLGPMAELGQLVAMAELGRELVLNRIELAVVGLDGPAVI